MKWTIVLVFLTLFFGSSSPSLCQAQGGWGGILDAMSTEERGEFIKIIVQTGLEGEVTPERHQRFWEIVDSNKWTKADVQEVWDRILGRSCTSQRYMTLAVLDAFYNRRDKKNAEFQEYEDHLMRLGVLTAEEVKKSDEFIYKVAHRETIKLEDVFGGPWQEKVFDEEMAQNYRETFDQLDRQYRLLLQLFDRKWKGYQ
jgi:hypothetical protein